jgi:uncharacterized protein YegP (UPF0339 family)
MVKPTGIDYSGLAFPKAVPKPAKSKRRSFAAVLAGPMNAALAAYYGTAAIPKGESRKKAKGRKNRADRKTRRDVKSLVFDRDGNCRAYGVSPVCRRRPEDRHELIPVGRGGKITVRNCVAVCRPCHDAIHYHLGGALHLDFDWPGKDNGNPPDADRPGQVAAVWRGIWKGVKPRKADSMKRNERDAVTKVEIFTGKDGAFYFRTKARNRQVGTVSEGYRRKSSAVRGAGRWHPGIPVIFVKDGEK